MRTADTPSVSARFVAWLRAVAAFTPASHLAPDEFSVRLAGFFPWTLSIYLASLLPRWLVSFVVAQSALQTAALVLALRSVAIDDAIRAFVSSGGSQIVIMGAGLDARSLRLLPMLRPNVRLFEVDSPGSSCEKQAMLQRHGWLAGTQANVTYIAQDFEKEPLSTLPEKLARAGQRRDQPTLTILEGVVMYLHAETVKATFDVTRTFGAKGSQLVVNHLAVPDALHADAYSYWRWWSLRGWTFWPLAFLFFRVWAGETVRSPSNGGIDLSKERIGGELRAHGWRLVWDHEAAETAQDKGMPAGAVKKLRKSGMMVALAQLE